MKFEFSKKDGSDCIQKIDASKFFLVVEASDLTIGDLGHNKIRFLTINGEEVGSNSNAIIQQFTLTSGRKLLIYNHAPRSAAYRTLFKSNINGTMKFESLTYIMQLSNEAQDMTINRIGFYSLGDILTLYPELCNNNWWIGALNTELKTNSTNNSLDATPNNNGSIRFHDRSVSGVDVSDVELFVKCLGTLPVNYNSINARWATPQTGSPVKYDIFENLPNITSIWLPYPNFTFFPTMKTNVFTGGADQMRAFKDDGITAPTAVTVAREKTSGTRTGFDYSYTRYFKEGYNSCVLPFAIELDELPVGLTVYVLNSYSAGSGVRFSKATASEDVGKQGDAYWEKNDVAANTPMIIKADEEGYYLIPGWKYVEKTGEDVYNYVEITASNAYKGRLSGYHAVESGDLKFVGSMENKVPDGDYSSRDNYGITADGLQIAKMGDGVKAGYYRAFLSLPSGVASRLSLSFEDDETTSINEIRHNSSNQVFDLQGRRVNNPTKGLYIVNGKKMFIK